MALRRNTKQRQFLYCLDKGADITMQLDTAAQKEAEGIKQKLVSTTTTAIFCSLHDLALKGNKS